MENNIINFTFENQGVRVVNMDGDPWWVASDVCKVLEVGNPSQALSRLDDDEKKTTLISNESAATGKSMMSFINEPGLYGLILSSRKPQAKPFMRWIKHEVLPSIRKHGGYLTPEKVEEALLNPDVLIKLATNLKEEREKRLAAEEEAKKLALLNEAQAETISVMKPKADYYDEILKSRNTMLATQIAKDYGMSAVAFNKLLNSLRIQYKSGTQWVLYQAYADLGYTRSETHTGGDDFHHWASVQTKWTQEGRLFLYNMLKKHGILPTCERSKN